MNRRFRWKKMGLIFAPDGRFDWMVSHAQNPSVLVLDDRLRVYFTCRPKRDSSGNSTSVTTFIDLDRRDPVRVLRVHDRPVLSPAEAGAFDQFGAMPGSVLRVGDEVRLYYVGWQRSTQVPYVHAIGLAVSRDGGITFERRGVVVGATPREPHLQNSPFVLNHDGLFHMWYSSGTEWIRTGDRMESVYVLMHATSPDGIQWQREGVPLIPFKVEHECQTNPCVVEIDGAFHMWFCYRHGLDFRNAERGYRIGYARSDDLVRWERNDDLSPLEPSPEGWDSQMVCYPCVVNVGGTFFLFYSGNRFGRDGFGYAVLEGPRQK